LRRSEALRTTGLFGGLIVAAAAVAALALLVLGGYDAREYGFEAAESGAERAVGDDPFAWDADGREDFEEAAALGTSHVIYALSPGGVEASARRTSRWIPEIRRAAERHGVDPVRLEAIVFLESAGRPEVMAGKTPEAASGLAQIIPSTAIDLLGMEVDLDRSIALTKAIGKALRKGDDRKAGRLARERAAVDERFDPEAALDGAGRYLAIAERRFGDPDLATASYHMGIGNLENVIRAYTGASEEEPIADTVAAEELSYAQLYFDSAPDEHAEAYELLSGFGDDSSEYLWKILASERILEQARSDPGELEETAELATAKATLEELYHPEGETEVFEDPGAIEDALEDGELAQVPAARQLGWVRDSQMGELAPKLGEERSLYRALRPEALATLAYMAARVKELSGAKQPLRVTSGVRDLTYQGLLAATNPEATPNYSLHTTGFSFDVLREYEDGEQAEAFQFTLDRLQALGVLDYAVEPRAIHVTVSERAEELLP
jgi:soluble lytic murein transglycosylase-like protein